jgi:thiol-disulfide isomerase/thioredoxin
MEMYRYVGIGTIAIIVALGIWANWPHEQTMNAVSSIAPEFTNIAGYINTQPVSLVSLHGNVVWLHFWRIGCSECQKDIPFINSMFAKYKPYGLHVVSIHSPEFDYEKDQVNVQKAINEDGIKYPVLLDNTRNTWQQYGDQFWPKDVLVGKDGYIVWSHIGADDDYAREMAIRTALAIRNY